MFYISSVEGVDGAGSEGLVSLASRAFNSLSFSLDSAELLEESAALLAASAALLEASALLIAVLALNVCSEASTAS